MRQRYVVRANGFALDGKGGMKNLLFPSVQKALQCFHLKFVDIVPSQGVHGHPRPLLRFSRKGNPDLIGVQSVLDYLNEGGSPLNMPCLGGKSIVSADRHSEFFLLFDQLKRGDLAFQRQFTWERKASAARILCGTSSKPAFQFYIPIGGDDLSMCRAEKRIALVEDLTQVLNVIRPNPTEIPFWFKGKLSSNDDYDYLNFYLRPNSRKPQDYRELIKEAV